MDAKLTIIYRAAEDSDLPIGVLESDAPMRAMITADVSDFNVYQWFTIFERALAAAGFSEYNIMDGACQLAFNDMRDHDNMRRLAAEYDLQDFTITPDQEPCDEHGKTDAAAA